MIPSDSILLRYCNLVDRHSHHKIVQDVHVECLSSVEYTEDIKLSCVCVNVEIRSIEIVPIEGGVERFYFCIRFKESISTLNLDLSE